MAAASAATAGVTTGIRAMLRKLFMSTTSIAVGTGTVLDIHSAIAPSEPAFQGSDLRDARVDESKNLMKVNMDATTSYFTIVVFAILLLLLIGTIAICCGWSPSKFAKREREERWKEEIRVMMQNRNKANAELSLDAEGWTNVKKTGPKLVEE